MNRATPQNHLAPFERFTRRMFTRIIAALSRTLSDEDLSVAQVAVLYLVDDGGEAPLRITALAEALGRSTSAVSRVVDGLVKRDLLMRAEDPEDRRAKVLQLTPEGRAIVEATSRDRLAVMTPLLGEMPEKEVGAILTVMQKLLSRPR